MPDVSSVYNDPNQLQSLVHNKNVSTTAKLKEVSIQFESIMMREYLKVAMGPMMKSHMGEAPAGSQFYEGILVDQMADSLSRTGQIGISDAFMKDMRSLIPKAELEAEKRAMEQKRMKPMNTPSNDATAAALGSNSEENQKNENSGNVETIQNLRQLRTANNKLI